MPILRIEQGDLTRADCDAIVNAANVTMLGGGGVDGAIHRAAGPELLAACRAVPSVDGVRCPFGEARITPGFRLAARHVVHTVGPIYGQTPNAPEVLRRAYHSSMTLADDNGLRSIAFPAISCGAYAYPLEEAARIAVETTRRSGWRVRDVRFVLFTARTFEVWQRVRDDLKKTSLQ
jgi:O-acetyl-ADP-ribose deacetylase (regulator of RNase III)